MTKIFLVVLFVSGLLITACPGSGTTNTNVGQDNTVQNTTTNNAVNVTNGDSNSAGNETNTDENSDSYAPPVFNGTTKKTVKRNRLEIPAILADVRTGKHSGFDRVVFEFKGSELPGYYIEYVGEPITQCGSGTAVELTGTGGLEIRFTPAQAHTDRGQPTLFFSDNEQNPNYDMIKQLKSTCDFEGNVTWVLGVSKANKYRVLTFENPTRLALDIEN